MDLLSDVDHVKNTINAAPFSLLALSEEPSVGPQLKDTQKKVTELDDLDILSESLMKENLPSNKEPSFDIKRAEKRTLNELKQKESPVMEMEVKDLTNELPLSPVTSKNKHLQGDELECNVSSHNVIVEQAKFGDASRPANREVLKQEFKINDIEIDVSNISPSKEIKPLTL